MQQRAKLFTTEIIHCNSFCKWSMSMERATGLRKGTGKGKVGGLVQHMNNVVGLKK